MRISFDLRLAELPGGGRVYAEKLFRYFLSKGPAADWRIYYNRHSRLQSELIGSVSELALCRGDDIAIELVPVRSDCLSLGQHIEFLKFHDDSQLRLSRFPLKFGKRLGNNFRILRGYLLTVNHCS